MRSMRAILAEFEERGARNNHAIRATSDDEIDENGRSRRPIGRTCGQYSDRFLG